MSPLAQAMLINGAVLLSLLESDLGPHRKIGPFRILRPVVTAGLVVPFFLHSVVTGGNGLALEVAGTVTGILIGLVAVRLMDVYRSPRTGRPVSRAGWAYAAFWLVVIGARATFSYGAAHWFGPQLGRWMAQNTISEAAFTDTLIFMAVTMLLVRTVGIALRAHTVRKRPAVTAPVAAS